MLYIQDRVIHMKHMEFRPAASLTPESLFAAKYNWLFGWAMHFAQGDRATAEDLLHDTFVRFVLTKPDLEKGENAEPLLYTYLKYSHLAYLRRLQRYPSTSLSIAEFDSIQLGLRQNVTAVDSIKVQDSLRRVVAYLTWRKESAKSASILILRFFHGYYPDEIMCLARMSRKSVDQGLRGAREEAGLYVSNPGRLRVMHQAEPPEVLPLRVALPSEQVIAELQKIIFSSCHTECFPEDLLLERYQAENSKSIERELLAHIVSCERCLDLVSRYSGIAPPADRSPEESLGPDRRSRGRSKQNASSSSDVSRALRMARDRVREAYEHQPRRLTVAVNGSVIATQDVNSSWSRQEIKLNADTEPEFIEVTSEQGVCLLAMHVAAMPPDSSPELRHEVELSRGRSLEVRLQFTSVGPVVEVAYHDPSLAADAEEEAEEADEQTPAESVAQFPAQTAAVSPDPTPCRPWLLRWRAWLGKLAVPRLNPIFAGSALLALAIVALVVFLAGNASKPGANDLLARAVAARTEGTTAAQPGVVRQKVRIRTAKRTVERTIYRDAQGQRQPKLQRLTPEDAQLQTDLAVADVGWDEPLSPVTYKDWHDRQKSPKDEVKRSGNGLLTLTTTAASGAIARESLIIRERDLHPIARTVEFRDAETVEIAEVDYSVLPWGAPTEPFFDPLARNTLSDASHPHLFLIPRTTAELDEAELQARLALNLLHADTDLHVVITRTGAGIRVRAIVKSDARKREMEARLKPLPNVAAEISTFRERERAPQSKAPTTLHLYENVAKSSLLQRYLTAKGWAPDRAADLSGQILNASLVAYSESKTLDELSQRFGPPYQLSGTSAGLFGRLIGNHAAALLAALDREEALLAETGLSGVSNVASAPALSFANSGQRNRALCERLVLAGAGGAENSPPESIASELRQSIHQTRAAMTRMTAALSHLNRFNATR